MKSDEICFVDFGNRLHMDTKQDIIYNNKQYSCIKGVVLHKKRTLKKYKKCSNFNYFWLENRKEIIKKLYKEILSVNPHLLEELKKQNNFAYIDNGNRHLGIGYYSINKTTSEVIWCGKNIMGDILMELKQEL